MQINIQTVLIGMVCILVAVACGQQIQLSGQSAKIETIEATYAPAEFTIDFKLEDGTASTTAPIKTINSLKNVINYLNAQVYEQQKAQQASQAGNANGSTTTPRSAEATN